MEPLPIQRRPPKDARPDRRGAQAVSATTLHLLPSNCSRGLSRMPIREGKEDVPQLSLGAVDRASFDASVS